MTASHFQMPGMLHFEELGEGKELRTVSLDWSSCCHTPLGVAVLVVLEDSEATDSVKIIMRRDQFLFLCGGLSGLFC